MPLLKSLGMTNTGNLFINLRKYLWPANRMDQRLPGSAPPMPNPVQHPQLFRQAGTGKVVLLIDELDKGNSALFESVTRLLDQNNLFH